MLLLKYQNMANRYEDGKFRKVRKLIGVCPENYGCIENTLAPDGSPLDAIILTNNPLKQGRIKLKVIGALTREDKDDKIILVPISSQIKTVRDIPAKRIKAIIKTWTGRLGQAPLKQIVDKEEAIKILKKYSF